MRRPIDPLAHDIREEIVMMLEGRELTPADIRRELPAAPSQATVGYHLAVLERARLVERIGGVCRLPQSP